MLDAVSTPLGTAVGLTLSAWLLFGVLLTVVPSRIGSYAALRVGARSGADSRPRQRVRRALVATQIAMTVVMLTGAGLLGRTLARLQSIDLGYQPDHLSILSYTAFVGPQGGLATAAQMTQTVKDLVAHIEATPGVVAASPVESGPFKGQALFVMQLVPADRPVSPRRKPRRACHSSSWVRIIFALSGSPSGAGHAEFQASRRHGEFPGCAVVVSETLGRRFWPNQDAVGKQLMRLGDTSRCTVVGVATDTHYRELKEQQARWRTSTGRKT